MISRFHYLTQDLKDCTHVEMALAFCGTTDIDWLQLRMKNKNESERFSIAMQVKEICDENKITLIINDYVDLALEVDANGVHLGKEDMSIEEAREILGSSKIIGGTANSFEDVKNLYFRGVDYIGLGPFNHTNTKENLSPILGLSGYNSILKQCREAAINIPIIAIGGIQTKDVQPIMMTGLHGLAISSAINLSRSKFRAISKLFDEMDQAISIKN